MLVDERLTVDAVTLRHVKRYVTAIRLAGRTGGRWLDAACGTGYGTELIAEVADLVVGVDSESRCLSADPHTEYRYFDLADHWPLMPGKFDVIVSIETLEHLTVQGQCVFVSECAKHLAPDGVLVLATPLGTGPSATNPWHLHEPTRDELDELLGYHFDASIETETYESTSGPAVQAWAVCKHRSK